MFEFIRTHQRLMQLALLLLIFPSFAFFGLEGYSRMHDGDDVVAKVGDQNITKQALDNAYREQMERMRQTFGEQFDQKMFDTPEAKQNVLDKLIAERAIAIEAARSHLTISTQALQQAIIDIPGMIDANGKFDRERYDSVLRAQRMTPPEFEASLRQQLIQQDVGSAIQATAFIPKSVASRISGMGDQEREIQELLFKQADYESQVKITDAMLKAYYDTHGAQFDVPEQAKINYIVLSLESIAAQIPVSDTDIQSYYEQNAKQFTIEEQRRASHILVAVKKDASKAEQAAAKTKAEGLLAKVRKNPAEFAKLAKENSDDTGSAEHGGDLGYFGHGMMVKPFEDAAYKLKEGDISDLVQSDFGYHIIQLTAIRPAVVKPLEEVKDEIANDIRKQQAAKKYSELAETFTNTVYEQADSLKPVADKLNLKIETVSDVTREPNPLLPPHALYNNPKFLTALFTNDAIKNKRNTEAVEVAPNVLIAAHIVDYTPATKRALAEVTNVVRQQVLQQEEEKLAIKAGEEKLAALKAKDDTAGFGATRTVSRAKNQGIDNAALVAVMRADVTKLPSYAGVALPGKGYAVYRISKVAQPENIDKNQREAERQQIGNMVAQQETLAYIEALKQKAKIKILKPIEMTDKSADEGNEK